MAWHDSRVLTAFCRLALLFIAFALAPAAPLALAQPGESYGVAPLSGVLKRIRDNRVVTIGYRESAVPFSYAGHGAQPYGYSIDLCLAVVDEIREAVGAVPLRVEYRRITPANRIAEVAAGHIDLECGATTNTAERRKHVAFSPVIFVTGTKLAVKRAGAVRSFRDLDGRTLVVPERTTNEEAVRALIASRKLRTTVTTASDLGEAFARLASAQADALASDDVLLYGYLSEKRLRGEYQVVGALLSYEPYGIMFARDDRPLADAVAAAFARLAATRELRWIYNKWFLRPLPSGVRLDLPMSVPLQRAFEVLGLPPE